MRILHIDTEQTWRGGENQLRLLLEGLANSEAECHLAVRPGSVAAQRLGVVAQMVQLPMRGGFSPRTAWILSDYCEKQGIDIIDAHTGNAHSLGLLIKTLRPKTKLVVHRRVDYAPSPGWFSRLKYLTPKIDRFVAISEAIEQVLVGYGVPKERIRVVKSSIRTEGYRDADRAAARAALIAAHGIDPKAVLIGNASALTAQKGYEVLLESAALLKAQGVPFHLLIAGDGDLREGLERQRTNLGLHDQVTFLGFIDYVPRFLSGLDILAVPSNYEGLGTILLDGLAAGLAVAATRVGGIPEVIIDGQTGLLSAVGDAVGHAANLRRLSEQPELRLKLNAAGRSHVAKHFSLEAMVEGNLGVYRELIRKEGEGE